MFRVGGFHVLNWVVFVAFVLCRFPFISPKSQNTSSALYFGISDPSGGMGMAWATSEAKIARQKHTE